MRWDLGATPFPEIPLPNDIATSLDPTSPTGVRLNASTVAPTAFERSLRAQFDELDGWGTFMPITVGFDDDLDLGDLLSRHRDDEFDFRDDAVYVVNLETGLPVPIDIGNGNFPLTLSDPAGFFENDPRAGQSNLLLSTVNEDTNGDGVLQPEEDTNFDGVMQRAAVFPAGGRPEDALTTFWEPENGARPHGGTLILRPIVPLAERTRYAVVLTDRLRGTNGPVRSPFDTLAHPQQLSWLAALQRHLSNPDLASRFYGNLAWSTPPGAPAPHGRVVFAWTFETESTVSPLFDLREGLYGRGPYAAISSIVPGFDIQLAHAGNACSDAQRNHPFTVSGAEIQSILRMLLPLIGIQGAQADALIASYDWVDYVAIAEISTPFLSGSPTSTDPDDRWHFDQIAHGLFGSDRVQLWIYVPRPHAGSSAPFPVVFDAHGYGGGALQSIGFAGYFARFGLATVAANAPTHGFPLPDAAGSALSAILGGQCLGPFATAVRAGRSRDLNGDGIKDPGGDFLSAHVFHTRDLVRQTALDYMQIVRALTDPSFARTGDVDYNHDGTLDAPGDMNGDGVVDIGQTRDGRPVPFFMWGESLGGITSMVLGGLEPSFTAVAPVSGGAGLTDVGLRSTVDGVAGAVIAPVLGPIVVAVPAAERAPVNGRTRTHCDPGDMSIRWITQDVNSIGELEIACTPLGGPNGAIAPGDDVVAYDFASNTERCARVPADGRLFLPVAADLNDRLALTVFRGNVISDYGTCARPDAAPLRTQIGTYTVGEGDCSISCGHVPPNAGPGTPAVMHSVQRGSMLSAPASGLGLRRQTGAFRRFIQLAQAGIDPGDPVNYAPLFFLRPRTTTPHPILSMTTIGDTDVPIATGNSFARAAGLLPFIRQPTGTTLDEYVAPTTIWNRYHRTPDGVLVDNGVIEGLARLERHPVPLGPDDLFDPDDLDEGRQPFGEVALTPPLRLVRAAHAVRDSSSPLEQPTAAAAEIASTWQPAPGTPLASFVNAYVIPTGVHTFPPSDPSLPWDVGAYLANLVARFFQSNGTDVEFYTNPTGHQCLENNSCSFIPQMP